MTSIFQIDENNDKWRILKSGVAILAEHNYSNAEVNGVMAVAITSIVSGFAVVILLFGIIISLLQTSRTGKDRHTFIRSHGGIYFICMIISNLVFLVGFMLSLVWAIQRKITFGSFCSIQAALKQFGNVATALWVLVIAAHTFSVVFLQLTVPNWVFFVTFLSVWLLSAAIIAAGPLFYVTDAMGPWYGISAQWCWTSDSYVMPRFTTEYFWVFLAVATSFLLYSLLFLKLRGNITSRMRFTFTARQPLGPEAVKVGNQMLWYPVAYAVLVVPIAGCRIYELKTATLVNLDLKMASAALFNLSGLVNVILYSATRKIFPISSLVPKFFRRDRNGDNNNSSSSGSADSNNSLVRKVTLRGRSTIEKIGISNPIRSESPDSDRSSMHEKPVVHSFGNQDSYSHSEQQSYQQQQQSSYPEQDLERGTMMNRERNGGQQRKSSWGWSTRQGGRTIKKPQPVWTLAPAQPYAPQYQNQNRDYTLDPVKTRSEE